MLRGLSFVLIAVFSYLAAYVHLTWSHQSFLQEEPVWIPFSNHQNTNDDRNLFDTLRISHRHLSTNNGTTETTTTGVQLEHDGFDWLRVLPIPIQFCLVVILILFSALFSGLTLGLMGLDATGLEIVMSGDDPRAAKAAARILPVRKDGNLLLCTLLLGNVAVNTLTGIIMADIAGGLVGFIVSTIIIVLFGEVIPQALCSRHALVIGEKTIPLVRVIQFLMYPFTKPLAFMLDKLLGHELGTTYSKAELNKLLEIHVKEGRFTAETGQVMTGALNFHDKLVRNIMTPLSKTFMLNVEEVLDFDCIAKIFKAGYSRIPVYDGEARNIIGLLFVKDLIFVNPDDGISVKNFVNIFGRRVHVVWVDDSLGDVLRGLKQGNSHMALVRDVVGDGSNDNTYEIVGIITLEDIIEQILGEQIYDETDHIALSDHELKNDRIVNFDWARLRLLDAKIVDETLPEEEVRAVSAHLRMNHGDIVSSVSDRQLRKMVASTQVLEIPQASKEIGEILPSEDQLIYTKGQPNDLCTLILSGRVSVIAGSDNFRSDVSSWTVLGSKALHDNLYRPDFSAYVSGGPCRCLRFTREKYVAAVYATKLELNPDSAHQMSPARTDVRSSLPATHQSSLARTDVRSSLPMTNQSSLPSYHPDRSMMQSANGIDSLIDEIFQNNIFVPIGEGRIPQENDVVSVKVEKNAIIPNSLHNSLRESLLAEREDAEDDKGGNLLKIRNQLLSAVLRRKGKGKLNQIDEEPIELPQDHSTSLDLV